MDELHAPRELLFVLDDGGLRDAGGRLEEERLDDEREAQPAAEPRAGAAADDQEVGHGDPVVREELLGERLVAREDEAARVAAGVGQAQQLEVANDVLVEGRHAGERLHQVEDDVRLEGADNRPDGAQPVMEAEHAHVVPHLLQRFRDVVLHLPLGLAHVDAGGVRGRDQVIVHERQKAELLHRNTRWPPL